MAGSTNFPAAKDDNSTLYQPGSGDLVAVQDHAQLHDNASVAIIATQTKLGTGATTAAANQLLVGTGSGASTWQGLTSAQLAAIVSNETGSGALVFGTSPTLTTPVIASIVNTGTLTLPTSTDTLVGRATTDTLTNKTLTTPAITWSNNTVTAASLATNAITLGYAQITTSFTTASTTAVQVTGLTVTVTIPAGGRRIKITGYASDIFISSSTSIGSAFTIWDGTVGSGTQLSRALGGYNSGSYAPGVIVMAVVSPSPGAKTYNLGLNSQAAGTSNIEAAATYPAFILVEAI